VLAYEVVTTGVKPDQTPSVLHSFIDARTGALLDQDDEIKTGTGRSMYSGTVDIGTSGSFSLTDPSRGGNYTTDLKGSTTGSGTTRSSGATRSGSTTTTTGGESRELGRSLSNDLVDVLAFELGDELLEPVVLGLNTDGLEDSLHIRRGGGGVTAKGSEKVSSDVLHLVFFM